MSVVGGGSEYADLVARSVQKLNCLLTLKSATSFDNVLVPTRGTWISVTHFPPPIDRSVQVMWIACKGSTLVRMVPLSNATSHWYSIRALYSDICGAIVFLDGRKEKGTKMRDVRSHLDEMSENSAEPENNAFSNAGSRYVITIHFRAGVRAFVCLEPTCDPDYGRLLMLGCHIQGSELPWSVPIRSSLRSGTMPVQDSNRLSV